MVNFLPIQQHLKIRYNLYHRQNWVITGLWSWSPLQNEDDLFSFVLLFEIQILSKTRLSNNKPKLMLPHAEDNEKHFLCCGLISEWGRKGILERGNVWSIILALWNVSSGFVFSCQAWLESGMGRKERDWGRAFCCKGKHRFDIFYTINFEEKEKSSSTEVNAREKSSAKLKASV